MYLSVEQFKKLEEIKNGMAENENKKIFSSVLADVLARHEKSNNKTALYIAEKRKHDKNYARGKKKLEK